MFVAQINQDALSAVSMVFPIQNLMIAFGVGIGVGVNALLSRSLGQGDSKRVNDAAVQGAYVYVVLYLIFLAVGLFFSEAFMRSQTDIESIISYGRDYMWIVCCLFLRTVHSASHREASSGNGQDRALHACAGARRDNQHRSRPDPHIRKDNPSRHR